MMFIQGEDFDSEDEVSHAERSAQEVRPGSNPSWCNSAIISTIWRSGDWGRSIRLQVDRPVLEIVKFRSTHFHAAGIRRHRHRRHRRHRALGVLAALCITIVGMDRLIITTVLFITSIPIFVVGPMLLLLVGADSSNWIDVPYGWSGLFHIDAALPVAVIANGHRCPSSCARRAPPCSKLRGQPYRHAPRAPKACPSHWIIMRHMMRPGA